MEVLKKIEKVLNVKIENIEKVQGRSFPLFDTVNLHGIKLALIKNPLFVVIGDDDVYEKRIEGNFIVVETDNGYILAKYTGEPNIEALRVETEKEEPEQVAEEQEEVEMQGEEDEEVDNSGDREEQKPEEDEGGGSSPVEEILEKMPKWADGVVVIKKDGSIAVLPIKRSTKKDGYYASVSWRPLDIQLDESLINHVITKNGMFKANIYVGDKYINIFVGSRSSNRPRRYYSGRR
jgi:hypothetical protein